MTGRKNPVIIFFILSFFILGIEMIIRYFSKVAAPVWVLGIIAIIIAGIVVAKSRPTTSSPPGQQAGLKWPKLSWKWVALLLIVVPGLINVGWYLYRDTIPSESYIFNTKSNFTNYWNDTNNNIQIQNNCVFGSGEMQLKNPGSMISWSKIEVVPCGTENLAVSFYTGDMIWQYEIKTSGELGENTKGSYHTASIYHGKISADYLWSSPSYDYIKSGESAGPYPVGIRRNRWWDFMSPKYTIYVLDGNKPIKEQTLAYTGTEGTPGSDEGKLSIKISGGAIKEIKIFKQ